MVIFDNTGGSPARFGRLLGAAQATSVDGSGRAATVTPITGGGGSIFLASSLLQLLLLSLLVVIRARVETLPVT